MRSIENNNIQQNKLTDSLPTGARGTNSSNNDENDETNVNLNSFGLTPPKPNDDDGAAYLTP